MTKNMQKRIEKVQKCKKATTKKATRYAIYWRSSCPMA
jgi:hypothetical protein